MAVITYHEYLRWIILIDVMRGSACRNTLHSIYFADIYIIRYSRRLKIYSSKISARLVLTQLRVTLMSYRNEMDRDLSRSHCIGFCDADWWGFLFIGLRRLSKLSCNRCFDTPWRPYDVTEMSIHNETKALSKIRHMMLASQINTAVCLMAWKGQQHKTSNHCIYGMLLWHSGTHW